MGVNLLFGVFDKEEFASLLKKSIGERSINQFAAKCGVSATYISKLLRGLIGNPPGVEIIKKISSEAYTVTYDELMSAAGHISDNTKPFQAPLIVPPADEVDTSGISDDDIQFLKFMRRAGPHLSEDQKRAMMELGKVFLKQSQIIDKIEESEDTNRPKK